MNFNHNIRVHAITACKSDEKIEYLKDLLYSVKRMEIPEKTTFIWSIYINGKSSNVFNFLCSQEIYKSVRIFKDLKQTTPGYARNKLAFNIESDYLLIMDSDDINFTNRLKHQLKEAVIWKASVVYSKIISFENGESNLLDSNHYTTSNSKKINSWFLLLKSFPKNPSALINTNDFKEVGGYDEGLKNSEDYMLWAKLHKRGKSFISLNLPLLYYRQNLGDLKKRRGFDKYKADLTVREFIIGNRILAIFFNILFSSYKILPNQIFNFIYRVYIWLSKK